MRAALAPVGALVLALACSSASERAPIVVAVSGTNATFSWTDGPIAALEVYRPDNQSVADPCRASGTSTAVWRIASSMKDPPPDLTIASPVTYGTLPANAVEITAVNALAPGQYTVAGLRYKDIDVDAGRSMVSSNCTSFTIK